jgi:hypothetical protein
MRLMLAHCSCRPRPAASVAIASPQERLVDDDAAEAFAWMNRQITWQSLLADLEVVAWLATGDPPA